MQQPWLDVHGGVSACLLTALMSGAMNAHIIVISIEFVPVHGR